MLVRAAAAAGLPPGQLWQPVTTRFLLPRPSLRSIHPDSLAILKAREVIAINQDELGVAGDLIWQQGASRVRLVGEGGSLGRSGWRAAAAYKINSSIDAALHHQVLSSLTPPLISCLC